jgi:dTDP-4-amino-4,6-dideoxygalactose transaminase
LHANAIPVFADIDGRTLTVDPIHIESLISPRTKAVIAVHLYGHPADMDPIMAVAEKHNLVVIEDCAQAHGALYKGRKVGSLGHIGCFSYQGSKNLAGGEGGMVVTDNETLFRRCVLVGGHPLRQKAEVPDDDELAPYIGEYCENYRMHPLAAAVLEANLPRLDDLNEARRRSAAALCERLADVPGIEPPQVSSDIHHVYHMIPFFYRKEQTDDLPKETYLSIASAKGVPIGNYVETPLHLRKRQREAMYYGRGCPWLCPHAERTVSFSEGDCPVAEQHCAETELTMGGGFLYAASEKLLDQIAEALRQAAKGI